MPDSLILLNSCKRITNMRTISKISIASLRSSKKKERKINLSKKNSFPLNSELNSHAKNSILKQITLIRNRINTITERPKKQKGKKHLRSSCLTIIRTVSKSRREITCFRMAFSRLACLL